MIPILVVSWNHCSTTTEPCLQSIRRYTGVRYRVLCVDNGSTDQTAAHLGELSRKDPRFEPMLLSENRGWAGGVLAGLERLKEEDEAFCLLNTDTLVTPRWLQKLREHLDRGEGLDAVSPREVSADPSLRREEAEPLAKPGTGVRGKLAPLDQVLLASAEIEQRFRGRVEPGLPSGYCALVRRDALPTLRAYLSDFESYRTGKKDARELFAGIRCGVAWDTLVFHARAGSGGYYEYRA